MCGEDAAASCFSARRAASDSPSQRVQAAAYHNDRMQPKPFFLIDDAGQRRHARPYHRRMVRPHAHHRFFTRTPTAV